MNLETVTALALGSLSIAFLCCFMFVVLIINVHRELDTLRYDSHSDTESSSSTSSSENHTYIYATDFLGSDALEGEEDPNHDFSVSLLFPFPVSQPSVSEDENPCRPKDDLI